MALAVLQRCTRMRRIFQFIPNHVVADGIFNTIYMTNHMDRQLLHMRNIRRYVFMTMQYRQSLNGRKYIQLTIKNPKIHLVKSYVTQCLGSRKTANVDCSNSRISTQHICTISL